jgi:hypothetical protein
VAYSDEQVARVCHEANKALQYIHGDPSPSLPWDCEPAEMRESAVEGVRQVRRGCTPRQLHESWVVTKREQGWVYGPEKDPAAKMHPCMVPYDDLPQTQKDKDQLFLMIVTALTVSGLAEVPASRYQEHGNLDQDPGRAGRRG